MATMMKVGMVVRNMGPASTKQTLRDCAQHADQRGIDHIWVTDHIAIPNDQSEGSGGRYLDPLATLAFLAGVTERVGLGVGVLVLPYRPALATAKWIASVQTLCDERLILGAGVGWMKAEFRATGVDFHRRGAITDEVLAFFNEAFANDEVSQNDQLFLFLPRPRKPPFIVGGAAQFAFPRIVTHADGWMPGRISPEELREPAAMLRAQMRAAGREDPQVIVLTTLPLDKPDETRRLLSAYANAGATSLVHFTRYTNVDEFKQAADQIDKYAQGA